MLNYLEFYVEPYDFNSDLKAWFKFLFESSNYKW